MLDLPTLDRVPRNWTMHRPSRFTARTALALLDAGLLPANATPGHTTTRLVDFGLQRWIDDHTRGINLMHFEVEYLEARDGDPAAATLRVNSRLQAKLIIGPVLADLERHKRGIYGPRPALAHTALHEIERASLFGVPIYTPAMALRWARRLYWRGFDSEIEMEQNRRKRGKQNPHPNLITRAAFDKLIPTWASCCGISELDINDLQHLMKDQSRLPGKLAAAVLDLRTTINENIAKRVAGINRDVDMIEPALHLRWKQNDLMRRIDDDRRHNLWRGRRDASTACFADITIPENTRNAAPYEERLTAALRGIEPLFAVLRAVEGVVHVLQGKRYE